MNDDIKKEQTAQEVQEHPIKESKQEAQEPTRRIDIAPDDDPHKSFAAFLERVKQKPLDVDADTLANIAAHIVSAYPPEEQAAAAAAAAERLQLNESAFKEAYTKAFEANTDLSKFATDYTQNVAQRAADVTLKMMQAAMLSIQAFLQSDAYKTIMESVAAVTTFLREHQYEIEAIANAADELQGLEPFLEMELEAAREEPQYAEFAALGIEQLLGNANMDGTPATETDQTDEYLEFVAEMFRRARQRKADFIEATGLVKEVESTAEELPRIISNPSELLNYPIDKPNSIIWDLLEESDPNGQVQLQIDTTSSKDRKRGKEALIYYALSFGDLPDGLHITKQLTPFDKRVCVAAAALYNAGNHIVTPSQIYSMMGGGSRPNDKDIAKVNSSATKMGTGRVYIDSTEEVKTNKGYKSFKYDGAILPFERVSAYINNKYTDAAIHLFREPPLITFARERGQVTGITRGLLESPISKTDANLRLEDYLLERIGHMKNPKSKAPRKMLYKTIFARCQIKTKMQKNRAPEKIKRYLDHYKKEGFIKSYTEDADGVTILL